MGAELRQTKGRITFFDTIRGISVVSMILFHFTYDLFFISHVKLTWFTPLLMQIWIPSISYPFIFIDLRKSGYPLSFYSCLTYIEEAIGPDKSSPNILWN